MYMDPVLTAAASADASSSEDKDYPPITLNDEQRAEIDRIMENHALIDSTSSPPSSVGTPSGATASSSDLPQEPLLQIKVNTTRSLKVVIHGNLSYQ